MVVGWTLNAAMVYLILVTARLTPDIWDPYSVLGIPSVSSSYAIWRAMAFNSDRLPMRRQSRAVTAGFP
jgi:preprotein translocase subunit Sec63